MDDCVLVSCASQAQKRVGQLVGALEAKGVCSRRQLAAAWARRPDFLREELAGWLRSGRAGVLDGLWHTMREEADLAPAVVAKRRRRTLGKGSKPGAGGVSGGGKIRRGAADVKGGGGGKWVM